MGVSLLLALCAFAEALAHPSRPDRQLPLVPVRRSNGLALGWLLDPLTAVMLVMVTFVGLLIFIYSTGYMAHDDNFTRFFCFLSLFAGAMLGVVIANSLLLLFMCWEIVGLTSYLLIGFWYHRPAPPPPRKKPSSPPASATSACSSAWSGSTRRPARCSSTTTAPAASSTARLTRLLAHLTVLGLLVSTAIGLLIFCGAVGKSGQFPLHVWLPDAMEGPTPSARSSTPPPWSPPASISSPASIRS